MVNFRPERQSHVIGTKIMSIYVLILYIFPMHWHYILHFCLNLQKAIRLSDGVVVVVENTGDFFFWFVAPIILLPLTVMSLLYSTRKILT